MLKASLVLVFLLGALLVGCGSPPRQDPPFRPPTEINIPLPTATRRSAPIVTPTAAAATVPPQSKVVIQGPNPVTFTIRQDKSVDISTMKQCRSFKMEGNGVAFEFPDPGNKPFQVTFGFEKVQPGRATIPGFGDIYPDQFVFMTWKGPEIALFYVSSIDPVKGVEVIVLDANSCSFGGRVI